MKNIIRHGSTKPTIEDLDDKQLGYSEEDQMLYIRDNDEIVQISGTASDGAPIGSIFAYAGTTAPDNYLICDGSTFSETDYPKLKEVLNSTTLPDLRNRFLEGKGSSETILAKKAAGLPNILGNLYGDVNHNENGLYWNGCGNGALQAYKETYSSSGVAQYTSSYTGSIRTRIGFNASSSNAIYGKSSTVQPASVLVNFIIKAK